ncbi:MAG: hypothetical protein C0412_21370 [Flavobacterium sp.]|nr:hypothetical protein [Flavobacterium sp.]
MNTLLVVGSSNVYKGHQGGFMNMVERTAVKEGFFVFKLLDTDGTKTLSFLEEQRHIDAIFIEVYYNGEKILKKVVLERRFSKRPYIMVSDFALWNFGLKYYRSGDRPSLFELSSYVDDIMCLDESELLLPFRFKKAIEYIKLKSFSDSFPVTSLACQATK